MHHLFFDTSTERAVIGLAAKGLLLDSIELPFGLQNSQHLVPALLDLLSRHCLTWKDFEFISCGLGPGSYTGIRVGVALAKGLSFGSKVPLTGFLSLEGFLPSFSGRFATLIDAKQSGVYLLKGVYEDNVATYIKAASLVSWDLLKDELEDVQTLVSPCFENILKKLPEHFSAKCEEKSPSVGHLAKLTYANRSKKEHSSSELKIVYLRDGI